MTAAEVRRLLRILQRERQKGFLAWQQLRRSSHDPDGPGADAAKRADGTHELVPFPVTTSDDRS